MKKPKRVKFELPDDFGEVVEILYKSKWIQGYLDDEEDGMYYFIAYADENPHVKIDDYVIGFGLTGPQLTEDKIRRYANS